MSEESLTHKTLKNSVYGFIGFVWPMLLSILITPILISNLGVQNFGLFLFINTVSGFVGIIIGGANISFVRQLVKYKDAEDKENLSRLIGTMHSIFLTLAISGFIIILGGFLIGSKTFPISEGFSFQQLLLFFGLVAINFFINAVTITYQMIPSALQRFDITTKISFTVMTISNLVSLVLVINGFGILYLFILQVLITIITGIVFYRISTKLIPESYYSLKLYKDELMTFINLVSANFINEIARTSLISLDRILIPIFSGSISQLTYYSVPGNLAARVPGTADNLSGILFPTSTSLYISGKTDALKNLYMRSTRLIMLLSLAISFGMILNAEKIMRYWLDESFAKNSTNILIILIVTNLIFSLLSPIASFLMGINKMKFNTLISVSMAFLNIIALIVLLPKFGITGAAWAYLISVLPIFFAMYFIEKRYLLLQGRIKYYVYFLIKTVVTTLISGTIVLFIFRDIITNFLTLAIFGPLSVILYLSVFIALGFLEKEDYNDIKNFVFLKLKIK